jgi:hypothetical protein
MKLLLFMVFVNVYIYFRLWTRIRIRNPRVTDSDPAKVTDTCGSGFESTTLAHTENNVIQYFFKKLQTHGLENMHAIPLLFHTVLDKKNPAQD